MSKIKKLKILLSSTNRLIIIFICFFLLFGILLSINSTIPLLEESSKEYNSGVITFLYAFSKIFWILFIGYCFSRIRYGYLIIIIIISIKSFFDGIFIGLSVANMALYGFLNSIKVLIKEFLLVDLTLIYLCNTNKLIYLRNEKEPVSLFVIVIVSVLYSILSLFI